ncbi:PadR family transcriptional regulator [Planctomonas deserti]|uniref:PadR family transcriptional regulator n=1 Tax=Planctomonas deserti TaxID=2144185 RepID=UPI000D37C931|nr:PadR family transcriptional regulator [Planctomonas deserti]
MTPPVFAHGHLRLYLLSLLAESPKHGYELIQSLSDRFGGTYTPSAGTVYPRLAKLEDEGLVSKQSDGRKTTYSITEAGRAELAARQDELDSIEVDMTDSVRRLADEVRSGVSVAMRSLRADLASAAREARGEPRPPGASPEPPDPHRVATASALREAEMILTDFRQQVRTDLRVHSTRSGLPDDVVPELRAQLARVRAELLERLG